MSINLTAGEKYTFSRLGGSSFILESSDNAHVEKHFRNDVCVTGSILVKGNEISMKDGSSNDTVFKLYDFQDEGIFDLYENNTLKTRIRANGDSFFMNSLGIGNTGPSRQLEVHEDDSDDFISLFRNSATETTAHCLRLRIDVATAETTNRYIQFDKTGGSGIEYIRGDGSGGVEFTGTAGTSDIRNKENITYLSASNYDASSILKQVDVIEYELKSEVTQSGQSKKRRMGFSAQQMLELWPYPVQKFDDINTENSASVGDDNFMYHKLNQGMMSPLIVKTIQEMMTTIDDLKARIETLESN